MRLNNIIGSIKMLKEKLLNRLSMLFLRSKDPDRSYFNIMRVIKRLNRMGIDINVAEVQRKAYGCKEVR